MMSLKEQLKNQFESSVGKIPDEIVAIMENATKSLAESDIAKGLKVGEKAPDFTLKNATGKEVSLSDTLQKGPLVLIFYRGEWCPYCNLELKAYQDLSSSFKEKGVQVVAITPEKPDHSLTMQQKHDLSFEVLSDETQSVIKSYNLSFELPEDLFQVYTKFGLDLEKHNADGLARQLPVPATYIIDQEGIIQYVEADPDYKERMEPKLALEKAETFIR
ncbi:peroxiredoxin-like family protein [Longirhabdus pacifica]|uniref:peroxiredoxin-like family protein n=1 Tax=Longirhabdus pacifica TaxID=2305227 RepID=UPI0013E8C65A|nr:peroxiredoxin-like family protein [Longirhabdus pacifica]